MQYTAADWRGHRCPPRALRFPPGDVVVVSGLPGSGKSTLIRRTVRVPRVDSQDARDRWERTLGRWLPYAAYRPLVRVAHYARLGRAVRSGDSVVVHDCGSMGWVRRWIARAARRRGAGLHVVLLDVEPAVARSGQRARGRAVSRYAFARHRRAVRRLLAAVEAGRLAGECESVVLLDRAGASALRAMRFEVAGPYAALPGPPRRPASAAADSR